MHKEQKVCRFLIIISGMLLCCKNLPVLFWGPVFCGAPVWPNMLNMPKSHGQTVTSFLGLLKLYV